MMFFYFFTKKIMRESTLWYGSCVFIRGFSFIVDANVFLLKLIELKIVLYKSCFDFIQGYREVVSGSGISFIVVEEKVVQVFEKFS